MRLFWVLKYSRGLQAPKPPGYNPEKLTARLELFSFNLPENILCYITILRGDQNHRRRFSLKNTQ